MTSINLRSLLDRKEALEKDQQEKSDVLQLKKESALTWPYHVKQVYSKYIYTPPPTRKSRIENRLFKKLERWCLQRTHGTPLFLDKPKLDLYYETEADITTCLATTLGTDDEIKLKVTRDLCLQMVDKVSANILNSVPFRKKKKQVLGWEFMLMQISQLDLPRNVVDRVKKRMEAVTGQKAKGKFFFSKIKAGY